MIQSTFQFVYFALVVLILFPASAMSTTLEIGDGNRVFTPLQSLKARRDHGVVKQAYDYSCGAAALATLLTYGLDDPITEAEVLHAVMDLLPADDKTRRKKEGLSLLDLQQIAIARGHRAEGFRLRPEYLSQLQGPVLVFIKPRGYEHFAILKGIRGDRAYLADPSLGNVRMPMYQFLKIWQTEKRTGIIFVVERPTGQFLPTLFAHDSSIRFGPPELLSTRQLLQIGNLSTKIPQLLAP